MNWEITSAQIISECLKEHGKGQLFFRTDGLEFEERRSELRRNYLDARETASPENRAAIVKAAITPGMTREEVSAAWGLLEEDTRLSFGNVTDDGSAVYAFFTLRVGDIYALYFKDRMLIGVRRTDNEVPAHEHELAMRLAEEYSGLYYFHDRHEGGVRGSDLEPVISWPVKRIEQHIRAKNLFREYEAALQKSGLDRENLSEVDCAQVALSILPYPAPPQEISYADVLDDEGQPMRSQSTSTPTEEWFWHIAEGNPRQVAFPTFDGEVELLSVRWFKESIFIVNEVPLRVDGVCQFDQVLVEWREGDPIPHFQQVIEHDGYRTVRVTLTDAENKRHLDRFVRDFVARKFDGRYRYEGNVLAFTIGYYELSNMLKRVLGYPGITWIYTDTLNQDSSDRGE
jgi:hypothetical protein